MSINPQGTGKEYEVILRATLVEDEDADDWVILSVPRIYAEHAYALFAIAQEMITILGDLGEDGTDYLRQLSNQIRVD